MGRDDRVQSLKLTLTTEERQALNSASWFATLPAVLRHDVLTSATVRRFKRGDMIFSRGKPIDSLMACAAGVVRLSHELPSGREMTLNYVPAGRWFGELPLPRNGCRSHDAFAHEATTVIVLGSAELKQILDRHPQLYATLLEVQTLQLRQFLSLVEDFVDRPVRGRLARQLTNLMRRYGIQTPGGCGIRLGIRIDQSELARLIGSSRQRVNEELGAIRRASVIRRDSAGWVVIDPDRLLQIAETNC
jgi:CRP-like cAMP-binding protein